MKGLLVAVVLTVSASGNVVAYGPQSAESLSSAAETSPAYGVLVRRKATVISELADLSERLTYKHPSLETKRFELRAIKLEMDRMRAVEKSRVSKLSNTYGTLILSKVVLEVELNDLLTHLTPQHPDVTKKRLELAALEREIENLLR
jgi:uncharacterized protein involved in exopolysaccharide biosynthesis